MSAVEWRCIDGRTSRQEQRERQNPPRARPGCSTRIAHHGDAGRYEDNIVVMKGTVVEAQLITPHSIIVFDYTDDSGKTSRWQAEMGGRAQMIKDFGWTPTTLKPGDKITLTGRKVKSGAPYMNLTDRANVVIKAAAPLDAK